MTYYKQGNFEVAQENLGIALSFCKDPTSAIYESILLNLAHCHRKNKDFESAVELYQQCLSINSKASGTLCALGLTYHQMGRVKEALELYHKAHFLNNEDPMISKLVQQALEDIIEFPIEDNYLLHI